MGSNECESFEIRAAAIQTINHPAFFSLLALRTPDKLTNDPQKFH